MEKQLDVLLVNPHLEFPSDTSGRSSFYRSREFLLNAGLLSITTYLYKQGIAVELCDLSISENPIYELEKVINSTKPKFIGISNQSCHSYLSTLAYTKLIKQISPETKVVVGGLHASGITGLVLQECDEVDFVVVGEGEQVMLGIISGKYTQRQVVNGIKSKINNLPSADYLLYPNYQYFVPYVEESRGCFSKCEYCISPQIHKSIRIRTPERILADIKSLQVLYGKNEFHFFLEANTFAANHKQTETLAELLSDIQGSWRTETRTDTFPVHLVSKLVQGGLRVLDIGLESGSPEMLVKMNKTKNPTMYLERGIKIAEEVAKVGGCLLKLNLMLYYEETAETIEETKRYVRRLNEICPLSVGIGPVRLEPGSARFNREFGVRDLSQFDGTFWGRTHCYPVDLSPGLSFADANIICTEIAQEFQTSRAYLRLNVILS